MDEKSKKEHRTSGAREQFVTRLTEALKAVDCDAAPTRIARAFNLRYPSEAVTIQAVRRWMQGESYPTDAKLTALANWLHVDPAWLRFGDTDAHPTPDFASANHDGLERDLALLNPAERQLLRKMTDLILEVRVARQIVKPRN
jgi:transcriptional regulator with XRE-family HTH domain